MKGIKNIVWLLLAGSLILTVACGGGNGDDEAVSDGRYVEVDITPPVEGRFSSFLSDDGTIVCFDSGLAVRYESADSGDSWSESPGPGSYTDRYQNAQGAALLPDGSLIVFIQEEGLVTVAPDGSSKPYPVSDIDKVIADGDNIMLSQLQVMGDRLLLSYNIGGMVSQSVRQGSPIGGQGPVTQDAPSGERRAPQPGNSSSGTTGGALLCR